MVHAAAPCPPDVKKRMLEWWGPTVDEYYAASEGGGTTVFAAEWLERPGTVGRAWSYSEIAIFDDEGTRLTEPHQIGTVYMKMAAGSFEYYKDQEKTRKNRIGEFFTVGDVGELDEDGWLFLRDRKIDMIISGGANIYPTEIESVLLTHPKVGDAAVFGIPHDDWGEEVKAVIEPAEGVVAGPDLERDILEFCAGRLAQFKTPKSIDFPLKSCLARPERQAVQAQRKLRGPLLGGAPARHLERAAGGSQRRRAARGEAQQSSASMAGSGSTTARASKSGTARWRNVVPTRGSSSDTPVANTAIPAAKVKNSEYRATPTRRAAMKACPRVAWAWPPIPAGGVKLTPLECRAASARTLTSAGRTVARMRAAVPETVSVFSIDSMMATPMAKPTWRAVLLAPEATPDLSGSTS